MNHVSETVGLRITHPTAREQHEVAIELASGSRGTAYVTAHSRTEAERMVKQHGYQVARGVQVAAPEEVNIARGLLGAVVGGVAALVVSAPAWWPRLAVLLGLN